MNNLEKQVLEDLSLSVPYFKYNNGIAYEVSSSANGIEFSYTSNNELTTYSVTENKLSVSLIDKIMSVLKERLDLEIENNKLSWYYEKIV